MLHFPLNKASFFLCFCSRRHARGSRERPGRDEYFSGASRAGRALASGPRGAALPWPSRILAVFRVSFSGARFQFCVKFSAIFRAILQIFAQLFREVLLRFFGKSVTLSLSTAPLYGAVRRSVARSSPCAEASPGRVARGPRSTPCAEASPGRRSRGGRALRRAPKRRPVENRAVASCRNAPDPPAPPPPCRAPLAGLGGARPAAPVLRAPGRALAGCRSRPGRPALPCARFVRYGPSCGSALINARHYPRRGGSAVSVMRAFRLRLAGARLGLAFFRAHPAPRTAAIHGGPERRPAGALSAKPLLRLVTSGLRSGLRRACRPAPNRTNRGSLKAGSPPRRSGGAPPLA